MTSEGNTAAAARTASLMLIASGGLVVALIMHHPTAAGDTVLIGTIHGLLMSLVLIMAAGFSLFTLWRGSLVAMIGLVPYVAGAIAGFAAGTINGFIAPSLLARGIASYVDLLWTSNQMLASLGIVATAAAFSLWSIDLWRLGWRMTAAFGLFAGLLPAMLLLTGSIDMHLGGAILSYSMNAAWTLWLGVMLWRTASARTPH